MIKCQRDKFNLPADKIYLNGAYMSPLLKEVEKVGMEGILMKRYPGSITPDDFYDTGDQIRKKFAQIIHSDSPEQVVIIPSVSYGIANVVQNIHLLPGQEVIIVDEQFPSNVYSWQRLVEKYSAKLRIIKPGENSKSRGADWNEKILDAIDTNTAVVTMPQVHWADGTKFDLKAIREKTRNVNALLIIDGTQSVGAMPFSVKEYEPDAVICATYKWLMGPFSSSLAYYAESFNDGVPIEENWMNRKDSKNFAQLVNYQPEFMPGARRYEVGQNYNFMLLPMLDKALEQIIEWGPSSIQEYCDAISRDSINNLKDRGYLIENEEFRGNHLFGIRLPMGLNFEQIKQKIADAGISVSIRGNAIRVSPNVYNIKGEMQRLAECLVY